MPVRTLSLHALALSLLAFVIALMPRAASAVEIQRFTTPGGINVWLVEENTVPLITMNFAWRGGAAQDPGGKAGVASFLTTMMDEGAGDMNSTAYQEREEALAMRMSFSAGRDSFFGEFRTLVETRDEAFEMLRLAVNEPRFDDDAFARMREQILLACAIPRPTRKPSWGAPGVTRCSAITPMAVRLPDSGHGFGDLD
ncbi:MAG: hypothetical protein R3D43_08450 [Tepidamorphaceae bacterium]